MTVERDGQQGQSVEGRAEVPLRVHSCGRIGMQATAPRVVLGRWVRRR